MWTLTWFWSRKAHTESTIEPSLSKIWEEPSQESNFLRYQVVFKIANFNKFDPIKQIKLFSHLYELYSYYFTGNRTVLGHTVLTAYTLHSLLNSCRHLCLWS